MPHSNYNPIKIIIADEHPLFREGLKGVLKTNLRKGIKLVVEVENGEELVCMVDRYQPHLVITDLKLCGKETAKKIIAKYPDTSLIGLSARADGHLIYEMVQIGLKSFLKKNVRVDEIIKAVKTVMHNQHYFCDCTSKLLPRLISPAVETSKKNNILFSQREIEMIKLICQQLSIKEIADLLNSSIRNIEDYSRKIKEKTEAKNLVGIAVFAIKNNLVQINEI